MTKNVNKFLEQYTYSPYVKTIYIDSNIWNEIPFQVIRDYKEELLNRKSSWDWLGTNRMDNLKLEFTKGFHDPHKKIVFWGPYGEVIFKERKCK